MCVDNYMHMCGHEGVHRCTCVCTCVCMGRLCPYRYVCVMGMQVVCVFKNIICRYSYFSYRHLSSPSFSPVVSDSLLLVIAVCHHEKQEKEELTAS